jgi:hypothetical protein
MAEQRKMQSGEHDLVDCGYALILLAAEDEYANSGTDRRNEQSDESKVSALAYARVEVSAVVVYPIDAIATLPLSALTRTVKVRRNDQSAMTSSGRPITPACFAVPHNDPALLHSEFSVEGLMPALCFALGHRRVRIEVSGDDACAISMYRTQSADPRTRLSE